MSIFDRFIKKEFIVVNYDGDKLYLTPLEACQHIASLGVDACEAEFESVFMTQKQFDAIPEWQG